MKNKMIASGTLVALLALSFSMSAMAGRGKNEGQGPDGQDHDGKRLDGLIASLNLTDVQKQQVEKLKADKKTKVEPLREKMRAAHEKMQAEWQKDVIDKKAIRALHKEIHALKGQLAEARLEFMLSLNDILTNEQRAKAKELFKKHREDKPGGGRGHGNGHGNGHGPDF